MIDSLAARRRRCPAAGVRYFSPSGLCPPHIYSCRYFDARGRYRFATSKRVAAAPLPADEILADAAAATIPYHGAARHLTHAAPSSAVESGRAARLCHVPRDVAPGVPRFDRIFDMMLLDAFLRILRLPYDIFPCRCRARVRRHFACRE